MMLPVAFCRWFRSLVLCLGALLGVACSQPIDDADASSRQAAGSPVATVVTADTVPELPMNELMAHVISHTAFEMWGWQGWIFDMEGKHSQFPKNDAEWEDAESAALTLSEVITVLLQPSRRVAVDGWDRAVQEVRGIARKAASAAEKHDEDAFFLAGQELDEACESCHRAVGIVE